MKLSEKRVHVYHYNGLHEGITAVFRVDWMNTIERYYTHVTRSSLDRLQELVKSDDYHTRVFLATDGSIDLHISHRSHIEGYCR